MIAHSLSIIVVANGRRFEWQIPFKNGCSLRGHWTYASKSAAKRAARKAFARLFPDATS